MNDISRKGAQAYLESWLYSHAACQDFQKFTEWWAKITKDTYVQSMDHVQATYFRITCI